MPTLVALGILTAAVAVAQSRPLQLEVTVADPNGVAIEGATVSVSVVDEQGTILERRVTKSRPDGRAFIPITADHRFVVAAELQDFSSASTVPIRPNNQAVYRLRLFLNRLSSGAQVSTDLPQPTLLGGKGARSHSELLYWGFDKIYAAKTAAAKVGTWRTLTEGRLGNITSVSAWSSTIAVTGRPPTATESIAVILRLPNMLIERMVGSDIYHVALSPGARELATTSPNQDSPGTVDITIWDLATGKPTTVLPSPAYPGARLTWHPDGKRLTYDVQSVASEKRDPETEIVTRTYTSRLETIDIATKKVDSLFPGEAPSWSPDGATLAYYYGGTVFIYRVQPKRTVALLKLRKTELTGVVSWSADGKQLAVNATAGPMGELLECYVVDVASGKARSLGTTTYFCGPWLTR